MTCPSISQLMVYQEKDPGKTGYVFDGWNLKEGTRAEQNLYLYPKWTHPSCTVSVRMTCPSISQLMVYSGSGSFS